MIFSENKNIHNGPEKRKECTRLNMRGYSEKMIESNLLEVKSDHERTSALFSLNSKNI